MSDKEDLDLIESAIEKGSKIAYSKLMQKYRDLIYYTLLKKTGKELDKTAMLLKLPSSFWKRKTKQAKMLSLLCQ